MADDSVVECKGTERAAKNVSPAFDFAPWSRSFDETKEPKQERKRKKKKEKRKKGKRNSKRNGHRSVGGRGARTANIIAIYKHSVRWLAAFSSPIFPRQLCIRSPRCREIQGIARTNSSTSIMERDGASARGGQKDEVIAARAERTCV